MEADEEVDEVVSQGTLMLEGVETKCVDCKLLFEPHAGPGGLWRCERCAPVYMKMMYGPPNDLSLEGPA